MTRVLFILAVGCVLAVCASLAQRQTEAVPAGSDQADRLLSQIEQSGLSRIDNELGALLRQVEAESRAALATTQPARVVSVLASDRNDMKEENLYVLGDQTAEFQGKFVIVGGDRYPVIAAIHEQPRNRTRVILPVGSNVSDRRATTMGVLP